MRHIDFEYAKQDMSRREEGLRRAQLNGTAFEPQSRRRFSWPFRMRNRQARAQQGRVVPSC